MDFFLFTCAERPQQRRRRLLPLLDDVAFVGCSIFSSNPIFKKYF
jgi:hypothetical protein